MSKAEYLLDRLSEATITKLQFSPGDISLKGGTTSLRKQANVGYKLLKTEVESEGTKTASTQENDVKIDSSIAEIQGHKVLYLEVMKTKPYQPLVISRGAVRKVAEALALMAISAAQVAKKKNIDYVALVIHSNFSLGKELRRWRKCVQVAASMLGGRIGDRIETDGNQLYVIG